MAAARSVYVEVAGSERGTLKIALRKDVPARKVWATLEKSRRVSAATHVLETREGSALGPEDPVLASTPGEGDAARRPRKGADGDRRPPAAASAKRRRDRPRSWRRAGAGWRGFLGAAKAKVVAVPIVARLEDLMPLRGVGDLRRGTGPRRLPPGSGAAAGGNRVRPRRRGRVRARRVPPRPQRRCRRRRGSTRGSWTATA